MESPPSVESVFLSGEPIASLFACLQTELACRNSSVSAQYAGCFWTGSGQLITWFLMHQHNAKHSLGLLLRGGSFALTLSSQLL